MFAGKFKQEDKTEPVVFDVSNLPESVDWVSKGAVGPVKNQGQCGSALVYAAVASMDAEHFIKTGSLLDLSEQQIMDCDG